MLEVVDLLEGEDDLGNCLMKGGSRSFMLRHELIGDAWCCSMASLDTFIHPDGVLGGFSDCVGKVSDVIATDCDAFSEEKK